MSSPPIEDAGVGETRPRSTASVRSASHSIPHSVRSASHSIPHSVAHSLASATGSGGTPTATGFSEDLGPDEHTELDLIPEAVLEEYVQTFLALDADGSGSISVDEIQEYLVSMDVDMSKIDVNAIVESLDEDGNGEIDIDEFIVAMHSISQARRAVRSVEVYRDFKVDDLVKSKFQQFRDSVWTLMEMPESSIAARVVAAIIIGTVTVSALAFIIESLPSLHRRHTEYFAALEVAAVTVFTIEFIVRIFAARGFRSFITNPLNIIDILAILPFYVERAAGQLSLGGASSIRVLRVARVFRLIKMSRYVEWLRMFFRTIAASAAPLGMIFFVTLLIVIFFSSGVYFFERGTWSEEDGIYLVNDVESDFGDIPSAFWWCVITMTTVGYGDLQPRTTWGKIIGSWTAMCGVIILAMPISVISHHFNIEYDRMIKARRIRAEQMRVARSGNATIATPSLGPIGTSRIVTLSAKDWSSPYLRAVLDSIKGSRLDMKSKLKQIEARNRESTIEGIHEVLEDMTNERINEVMRRASIAGIV